jgi:uncharacterized membrane protein
MSDKKTGVHFFASTALGGILFLLPVVVLVVVLGKAIGLMMIVAEPMASWLPIDTVGGVALANVIALLAVLVVCFLAGLLARHALASAFMRNLESRVLVNLPGYLMIKSLVSGFDESKVAGLKPVALQLGTAERVGYEIEKLSDGRSMVFIPSPPNPFSGITQVLPPDQITYLDVPLKQVMEVTENYGHGVQEILAKKKQPEE